jgi:predicted TIM-barrel fold metal-dependent hydrolase
MNRRGSLQGSVASVLHGLPVFDSHLHIIDPAFPLIRSQGYVPRPFTATDYLNAVADMEVVGGAVVSGSFQGYDRSFLGPALAALGAGFVGVLQIPEDLSDNEILDLDALGVRALRFNFYRGLGPDLAGMGRLARRVYDLAGWHAELYLDAADLPELASALAALPRIVIDHLGLTRAGLPHLLRLVGSGACVKATGFGRLDYPAVEALPRIYAENPAALLFGTDLPSTRAARPYSPLDLDLIAHTLGTGRELERVLYDNAMALYRPAQQPPL